MQSYRWNSTPPTSNRFSKQLKLKSLKLLFFIKIFFCIDVFWLFVTPSKPLLTAFMWSFHCLQHHIWCSYHYLAQPGGGVYGRAHPRDYIITTREHSPLLYETTSDWGILGNSASRHFILAPSSCLLTEHFLQLTTEDPGLVCLRPVHSGETSWNHSPDWSFPENLIFNYHPSRAWSVIKHAFGILASQ